MKNINGRARKRHLAKPQNVGGQLNITIIKVLLKNKSKMVNENIPTKKSEKDIEMIVDKFVNELKGFTQSQVYTVTYQLMKRTEDIAIIS